MDINDLKRALRTTITPAILALEVVILIQLISIGKLDYQLNCAVTLISIAIPFTTILTIIQIGVNLKNQNGKADNDSDYNSNVQTGLEIFTNSLFLVILECIFLHFEGSEGLVFLAAVVFSTFILWHFITWLKKP